MANFYLIKLLLQYPDASNKLKLLGSLEFLERCNAGILSEYVSVSKYMEKDTLTGQIIDRIAKVCSENEDFLKEVELKQFYSKQL